MTKALRAVAIRIAEAVDCDKTHLTRGVACRAIDAYLDEIDAVSCDALEISAGWKWRDRAWASFLRNELARL